MVLRCIDTNKSGAVSMRENSSSYRKADVLKRQDVFEEKTAINQRQSKWNEEPDQTKSVMQCSVIYLDTRGIQYVMIITQSTQILEL